MKGCLILLLCAVAGVWQAHAQFGFRGMGSCFGVSMYDPSSKSFCCKGNMYPAGANPNGKGCCGKHLVDRSTHLCCSNDPFPKGPGMKCCDKTYIDVKTQICCDGEALFKMEGTQTLCCGKKAYSPVGFTCCNSDLIPKSEAKHNIACDPGNDADQIVNNQGPANTNSPAPNHPRPIRGHPAHSPPRGASHSPNVFVHGPPPPPHHPLPHPGHPPPGYRQPPPPPPNFPGMAGRPPAFETLQRLQRLMNRGGQRG